MKAAPQNTLRSDILILSALASIVLIVHFLLGNGYGFHQDELQFLDDARHLQWGFVAYPPMTSFAGRIAIDLFGISPQVFRLPAAIVDSAMLVVVGLITRGLGGGRAAQVLALLAMLPVALAYSSVLQYNTFDDMAWALLALSVGRLLRTGNPRWWLAAGAAVGLGILSKYSITFPVVSLVAAVCVLPSQRHHLRRRWLWLGALVAFAIASPNLYWLATHHFLTLQMEHHIHLRDVRLGRTSSYYSDQLKFTLFGFPLAITGLIWLLRSPRFRLLSALYIGPFVLLAVAQGRGYYLLPGYIVLYAAGAVALERGIAAWSPLSRRAAWSAAAVALLCGSVAMSLYYLPIATQGSRLWLWQMYNNPDMPREIGWPQLARQVAHIRDSLPASERVRLALVAGDYSSAGALALYGPAYHLPTPVSTANSFYDRGWGPFSPETVIVVGSNLPDLDRFFSRCSLAGLVQLPYNVQNDLTRYAPDIYVCTSPREPWPKIWAHARQFG
jgi:4-amino-4-deoxy-L-arabinose transferase-like glycosyltransferase